MKTRFFAAASAALLSLSLVAGAPAFAQVQLEDSVSTQLITLGFMPGDWVITEEQALELQNVLSSSDSDETKKGRVEQIMGIE